MDVLLRQLPRRTNNLLFLCKNVFPSSIAAIASHQPSLSVSHMIKKSDFHSSPAVMDEEPQRMGPKKWPAHNNKIFPPQLPHEERRPAFVCHFKANVKYSPYKMWYIASMIRGMSIDEALKQLDFVNKKGAAIIKETLLEAQELAIKEHNVEYKSNLWVSESFATKGIVMKGIRRHARMRVGIVKYFHCHYYVRLEEGPPPKYFYVENAPKTTKSMLSEWVDQMRSRRIPGSL